jgi:ElaA protein
MELTIKRYEDLSLDELYEILRTRAAVFVVEQQCPYQDLDCRDRQAWHVFYHDEHGIAAYLRVIDAGVQCQSVAIGRVITTRRGKGFGLKILQEGIRVAEEKMCATSIEIEAQVYAKGFYEKVGFRQTSEEFLEDGITHIKMTR